MIVVGRDADEGLVFLRKASQWRPEEPRYAFAVAYHLHRSGAVEQSVQELQRMLDAHPSYLDGYTLLGDILVEQGRVSEAAELYRRACENEDLPMAARQAFAERASLLSSP